MTTETPCLGGCYKVPLVDAAGDDCMPDYRLARTVHVPNCPNAKPVDPPACECGAAIGHVCHAAECVPVCAYHASTCPARRATEPQGCIICGNVLTEGGEPYCWDHQPEPPACKCMADEYNTRGCGPQFKRIPHALNCPKRPVQALLAEPQGSEGSEPQIDFENAVKWANIVAKYSRSSAIALEANAGRALLALKARVEELESIIAAVSCDEATVRDCARYCAHGEDVLHAEARAIRARKEASNGKR